MYPIGGGRISGAHPHLVINLIPSRSYHLYSVHDVMHMSSGHMSSGRPHHSMESSRHITISPSVNLITLSFHRVYITVALPHHPCIPSYNPMIGLSSHHHIRHHHLISYTIDSSIHQLIASPILISSSNAPHSNEPSCFYRITSSYPHHTLTYEGSGYLMEAIV